VRGYANHASTGERAHAWAHVLREEVESRQLYADFRGMNPHGRALALALGALVPPYDFFIERETRPSAFVFAIDRWKRLKAEGWDVDALTFDDGGQVTALVGLGCRYVSATTRAEAS